MRNVILWNMLTLDGRFEGPTSWDLGFHELVWGEELERFSLEQGAQADTLLFGRVTYRGMADYWTQATGATADFMNSVHKVVFSTTLDRADWHNSRLVRGDAAGEVTALKRGPGRDMLIFGSATLTAELMRHDLIDEYRLCVVPLVLGAGAPLFRADRPHAMELLEARPLATGGVILRYRPRRAAGA